MYVMEVPIPSNITEPMTSSRVSRGHFFKCLGHSSGGRQKETMVLGESCPYINQHPTTHDFGDDKNPHEVFPTHVGERNKDEFNGNTERLQGGQRRESGDRWDVQDVQVAGTDKENVKGNIIKKEPKKKIYKHCSLCGAISSDMSMFTQARSGQTPA